MLIPLTDWVKKIGVTEAQARSWIRRGRLKATKGRKVVTVLCVDSRTTKPKRYGRLPA